MPASSSGRCVSGVISCPSGSGAGRRCGGTKNSGYPNALTGPVQMMICLPARSAASTCQSSQEGSNFPGAGSIRSQ